MRILQTVLVAAALALAVSRAVETRQQSTFRAVTNGVVASAFVTVHGAPVDDLTAADFAVTDDGAPQTVIVTRDTRPLDVTLWVENARPMTPWIEPRQRAMNELADALQPTDRVRLLVDGEVTREAAAWQPPSRDLSGRLGLPTDLYATSSADGLLDALLTLGPSHRRQVVVSIFASRSSLELSEELLLPIAGSTDAVVYLMGLPPPGTIPTNWFAGLGRLAAITGGQLLLAADPNETGDRYGQFRVRAMPGVPIDSGGAIIAAFKDASAAMAQIVNDVRHAYVISFTPSHPAPGWHTIGVKVTKPKFEKAVVRARQKYFVGGGR